MSKLWHQITLITFILLITKSTIAKIASEMDWYCINNATCVQEKSKDLLMHLRNNQTVQIGAISIENTGGNVSNRRAGRMLSFLGSHAFKFNLGKFALSLQRTDDQKYLEVGVEVKGSSQGRAKKLMKMAIPLLMGFKTLGWLMLAIVGVSLLTFKAFLVSKVALLIASILTIKKLFERPIMMMAEHQPQYMVEFQPEAVAPVYPGSGYAASDLYAYGATALASPDVEQQDISEVSQHYTNTPVELDPSNSTGVLQTAKRRDVVRRRPMYYTKRFPKLAYRSRLTAA